MGKPISLDKKRDKKRISPFLERYQLVLAENIPNEYKAIPISYKSDEIDKFEVILFHRIMEKYYGRPCQLECELDEESTRKYGDQKLILNRREGEHSWDWAFADDVKVEMEKEISEGNIIPIPLEWKYYVSTKSDEIIKISTEDHHTSIFISLFLTSNQSEPSKNGIKEAEKFISDLLKEANNLQNRFNVKKEFKKGKSIQHYSLFNVYRSNYISAGMMLELAEEKEQLIIAEGLRFDARTEDIRDPERVAHIDRHILAKGMYYAASIAYYFMSFEGFVNLIYHAFLKHQYRESDLNLEIKLDLEKKLLLMPSLCNGFKNEWIDYKSELYKNFKKLKNYRNLFFIQKWKIL